MLGLSATTTLLFSMATAMGEILTTILRIACPAVSAICALTILRTTETSLLSTVRSTAPESYPNPKLVYAIPIVCFLLASVIRHTGVAGQELIAEPAELVCNYFCTLLGGVIGVLIVLFVQRTKNTACSLLLMPIAMLSLGYFAFSHQGGSGTVVGSALITSSRAWLEVCVFAVLVIRMTQGMRMPMAAFVFVGTEVVAGLLRRIAAPLFAQTLGISFDAFAQQASMYLCFILMALCIATLAMLLMRMNSTLIREQ